MSSTESNIDLDISKNDLQEAAKELASQKAQARRKRIQSTLSDWVWVSEAYCFVRRSDGKVWSDRQWGAHYGHLVDKGNILDYAIKKRGYVDKFESLVFEPGAPEEIDGVAYNLWRRPRIVAATGEADWFVEHVGYLFPNQKAAAVVLDYLALLVREPFEKILFALLIYGKKHGTGKSAIGLLLQKLIGVGNVVFPSNDEISEKYTEWQEGAQLAIIEELMMLGRQQVSNRLKPVITQPDLRIRAMYRASYSTPNRLNLLAFTNYPDALKVENEDRRWLIVESPVEPTTPEYYAELFAHLENDEDIAAVKQFLQNRDVELNPKGRAPMSAAKAEMVEQALSNEEAFLLERFETGAEPFDFDLVRRDDLIDAVKASSGHFGRGSTVW